MNMINRPIKAVTIYLLTGLTLIVVMSLLGRVFSGPESTTNFSPYHEIGWGIFVIITSVILFFVLKRQKEILLGSEEQYRSLFSSNPNPMWIYNLDTYYFIEINDAAVEKYGYTREEFLNMTVLDIRPPEDKLKVMSFIEEIKSGEKTAGQWTHMKKNGETFIASIKSHPVRFNNTSCALVLAVDITESVRREQQLEESYRKEIELNEALASHIELIKKSTSENRLINEIMDKINNFVIIVGKDGVISWVNKAFTDFSGYSLHEVEGKRRDQLLFGPATDPETVKQIDSSIEKHEFFTTELINYTKERRPYWVEMSISPIYDEEGELDCFVSIETLINERKAREQRIQEQNKALRQLAWVSSHEIRKPVTSIIGLITLIRTLEDGPQKQECLSLLDECSVELDNIVKDITKRVNIAEAVPPASIT